MGRVVIVVAPGAGFGPGAVAAAWNDDDDASVAGRAGVEPAGDEVFFPGLVELVVIPLVVNVASSAVYDLVKKLARRLQRDGEQEPEPEVEVEQPQVTAGGGDVVIVIRVGGEPR